jgi:hypothetical protein
VGGGGGGGGGHWYGKEEQQQQLVADFVAALQAVAVDLPEQGVLSVDQGVERTEKHPGHNTCMPTAAAARSRAYEAYSHYLAHGAQQCLKAR